MLGISAVGCDIISPRVEYGSPYADFEVKGKVEDALRSLPLQGIRISATDESGEMTYASATTDPEGRFELLWSDFPSETATLRAEDIDGPDNGGAFASLTINVPLEQTGEGDGWYQGSYSAADVIFSLNEDLNSEQ